jgi:hypothetical protein
VVSSYRCLKIARAADRELVELGFIQRRLYPTLVISGLGCARWSWPIGTTVEAEVLVVLGLPVAAGSSRASTPVVQAETPALIGRTGVMAVGHRTGSRLVVIPLTRLDLNRTSTRMASSMRGLVSRKMVLAGNLSFAVAGVADSVAAAGGEGTQTSYL